MKGILKISKTKKAKLQITIEFERKGKTKVFNVTDNYFIEQIKEEDNNKEVEFLIENNRLTEIKIDDKSIRKEITNTSRLGNKSEKQNFEEEFVYKDLFEPKYLPEDTLEIFGKHNLVDAIDNYYLKLNYGAKVEFKKDDRGNDNINFLFFKTDRKSKTIYFIKPKFGLLPKIDFSGLKGRFDLNELSLSTAWRLIVGLGDESVYETSITLHHIYGIPYIPASAIKGVVRSYIIQEKFNNDENTALSNEDFINIFGSQDQEGNIIFFDAFPIEPPSIEPDVMNVHYPDYYSKDNIPPTDYQNPNPIYFLTVRGKFKFVVAARKGKLVDYIIPQPDGYQSQVGHKYESGTIMWWLYEALSTHGIGAKTAVGYGRMK